MSWLVLKNLVSCVRRRVVPFRTVPGEYCTFDDAGSWCQNVSKPMAKTAIQLKILHFGGRNVRIYQNPWRKRPFNSKSCILGVGMSEFIKTHCETGHSAQKHGFQGSGCQNSSKLTLKPAIRLKLSHFRGRDVRIYQNPWRKRPSGLKSRILGVWMSEFIKTHCENGHPAPNPTFSGSGCQNVSKPMAKTAIRLKILHFRGRNVRIYQNPLWNWPFGSNSRILGVGMSKFIKTHGETAIQFKIPDFMVGNT